MPANVSREYVSQALCQTLQTTKINFEKKCCLQVFNTQNEFESSTNLSTRALFCICCVIYTIFYVMIVYFYISLSLVVVPTARLLMNIVT